MDIDSSTTASETLYSLNKNDSVLVLSLINKFVKVHLIKNTIFEGFLLSVDPLTKSIILLIPRNQTFQTMLIPGHAVLHLVETQAPVGITPPPQKQVIKENPEEIQERKIKLISWFKSNLLPVDSSGENIVVGAVSILPPYNISDIYAENPVVALQIAKTMERMPESL